MSVQMGGGITTAAAVVGKRPWALRLRRRRRRLAGGTIRLGSERRARWTGFGFRVRVGFDVCRPAVRLRILVGFVLRRVKKALMVVANSNGQLIGYWSFPFMYPISGFHSPALL